MLIFVYSMLCSYGVIHCVCEVCVGGGLTVIMLLMLYEVTTVGMYRYRQN